MERVLILEHHHEPWGDGSLSFVKGSFYMIDDPLRQKLIDAKLAVPESEYPAFAEAEKVAEEDARLAVLSPNHEPEESK